MVVFEIISTPLEGFVIENGEKTMNYSKKRKGATELKL